MTHTIELKEEIHIIRLEKLYTEYENRGILDEIDELILEEYDRFILDLGQLKFLNSAGFSLMIAILTKSRNAGGETVITHINQKIESLLVMMKLKNVFQVFEDEDEAIKFLKLDAEQSEESEENAQQENEKTDKE